MAKPIRSCVNDAIDMHFALRSMGFLTHYATNLTSNDMQSRMNRFVESIEPNAIVVFYFSGHGVQYDGNNYLIPINNNEINTDTIKLYAVNVEQFIQTMHNKNPRAVIVILDCCRPYMKLISLTPFFDKEPLGLLQGLAPIRPPPSTIIAYSCTPRSTSLALSRNGRNSLYTYHLLRHITTPNVDIDTVFRCVALDVQKDTNNRQIPDRYSNVHENIYLVINPYLKSPASSNGMQPNLFFRKCILQDF